MIPYSCNKTLYTLFFLIHNYIVFILEHDPTRTATEFHKCEQQGNIYGILKVPLEIYHLNISIFTELFC